MQKMRQILQKNGLLFGPDAQKAQKAESPFLLIKGQALASIELTPPEPDREDNPIQRRKPE